MGRNRRQYVIFFIGGLFVIYWLVAYMQAPSDPSLYVKMDPLLDPDTKAKLSERKIGLTAEHKQFRLNEKPFYILSGAIHYFRVVPDYWLDRLTKLKAAGLNTVETYVPWNMHEPSRGAYRFEGMLDLRNFLHTADSLGLYVILRPGPYICAEWDFGGLPSWLLRDSSMQVRSDHPAFMEAVEAYLSRIASEVHDHQYMQGGPIIAFQVENEFGSYAENTVYMERLKKLFTDNSLTEVLFTSDNEKGLFRGSLPGVLSSINFQTVAEGEKLMSKLREADPEIPLMVMEFWTGWFDHWGEAHHTVSTKQFKETLEFILRNAQGVNFYMFHGGTNFGFFNGANTNPYAPTVTSYDYDAPLNEYGHPTEKYSITKQLISELIPMEMRGVTKLNTPHVNPVGLPQAYGKANVLKYLPFSTMLRYLHEMEIANIAPMETLEMFSADSYHGLGFIVYRKQLSLPAGGHKLHFLASIKDRAIILVDGSEVAVIDRSGLSGTLKPDAPTLNFNSVGESCTLDIIVENLGRVNYASEESNILNDERRGIIGTIEIDDQVVQMWKVYLLNFGDQFLSDISYSDLWQDVPRDISQLSRSPTMFSVNIDLSGEPQDTFLTLHTDQNTNVRLRWTKGVAFVNNFILGRYWTDPSSLYVPAPLMRPGSNEFIIFELHHPDNHVYFVDRPLFNTRQLSATHDL